MESAELLDLLGNENRRRILRLLSRKPCYVTEIGEYLDVSPKAVIDHLEKLEQAGLVESRTDGSRRKYFHIARDVRLEVTVSRHEYGTKSAYPANPAMDIRGRCAHVRLDVESDTTASESPDGGGVGSSAEVGELAAEYGRLREMEEELSLAQRWVRGRVADLLDRVQTAVGAESDAQFHADLLAAVVSTDGSRRAVVDDVDAPPREVRRGLTRLVEAGVLVCDDDRYSVSEPA
ncbi:MAG: putative transcriptional regulator [halophilic archaeon J07HB67]|jgi:transcriptional regulator, ArsR family|nr:MAG: putative transcriptional regulator [halophilic archaeon J07HB67]